MTKCILVGRRKLGKCKKNVFPDVKTNRPILRRCGVGIL